MEQGQWRAWADFFKYKRPYEDKWGTLHDPVTDWDERLKYYQHWVLLRVSDATRCKARPADVGAHALIRAEERRRKESLDRAYRLEAEYLEWANRRKQWKRRKKRKNKQKQKHQQRERQQDGPKAVVQGPGQGWAAPQGR